MLGWLSITQVYRLVFAAYRAQWRNLLLVCAVLFAPLSLLEAINIDVQLDSISGIGAAKVLAVLAVVALGALTLTIGALIYSAFAERLFERWRAGHEPPWAWDVVRGLPLLRLLILDAVLAVVIAVGMVLFVVPGVLVFGWFSLSAVLVTSEGLGIRAALRRSRELVRGNFVRVVVALALPLAFNAILDEALGALDVAAFGEGLLGAWLTAYLSSMVAMPVTALALVAVTDELVRGQAARPARR